MPRIGERKIATLSLNREDRALPAIPARSLGFEPVSVEGRK
jgi:hypothetical protein